MERKEAEYRNITKQLITETSDAILFCVVYAKVKEIKFSTEYPNSREFLQVIRNACSSALIVQLAKLLDKSGFSIYKACDYLVVYPCLFGKSKKDTNKLIKNIKEKLKKNEAIIKNLIEQRNRFHVHLDNKEIKESVYKVFEVHPLNLNEIKSLLNDLCQCLGDLMRVDRNENDPFLDYSDEADIRNYLIDNDTISKQLNIDKILLKLKF